MNLINIVRVVLICIGFPMAFSKKRQLRVCSLGLVTLAFLIDMVKCAVQHNIEQTVLTGFVVLLYYYVYRKASKFS